MEAKTFDTRRLVMTALFTALIITGAFIRVPAGPVPFTLTTFFVLTAGLILGPVSGAAAAGLYLFLGALGLPVFSKGGGIALLFGPTGGYLFGYIPAAFAAGLLSRFRGSGTPFFTAGTALLGCIAGSTLIYLFGVPWLKIALDMDWNSAVGAGLLPFIPGDLIKSAGAVAVFLSLRKSMPQLIQEGVKAER